MSAPARQALAEAQRQPLAPVDLVGVPPAERATVAAAVEDASVSGFRFAMGTGAVLVALGGILGAIGIRDPHEGRRVNAADCPGGQLVGRRGTQRGPAPPYRSARAQPSQWRTMELEGIHHITCITGDAPGNVDFYVRVLGLRMVKKTVNQDDPSVYHLFYADEHGSAGSDLTFFEYPGARRGRAGAGMVHRITWRVGSEEALDFWADRLDSEGIETERGRGPPALQ